MGLCQGGGGRSGSSSVVQDPHFDRLANVLEKARNDAQYLERRQPKIAKLKEVLREHFQRHGKVGSSTRALVFSQLRATVQEIKAELVDVPGENRCVIFGIACSTLTNIVVCH